MPHGFMAVGGARARGRRRRTRGTCARVGEAGAGYDRTYARLARGDAPLGWLRVVLFGLTRLANHRGGGGGGASARDRAHAAASRAAGLAWLLGRRGRANVLRVAAVAEGWPLKLHGEE